ncbi:hypothetical protein FJZ22_02080 [Candidatus Pacearchaeota archaeon]|nr:hypothetical protein [Candidatus Pacearchaeota archaeon]
MEEQQTEKNSRVWIWILIVLILILIGVGIYFWLSGDVNSAISAGTEAGSSIPQPPALPN